MLLIRGNMPNNTQAKTSQSEASQGDIIWDIAFWVVKNIDESKFECGYHETSKLAEEILSKQVVANEPSENEHLDTLLEDAEVKLGDKAAAAREAVTYVLKGFCQFSSVYRKNWLKVYRDFVKEDADQRYKLMVDTVDSNKQLVGV